RRPAGAARRVAAGDGRCEGAEGAREPHAHRSTWLGRGRADQGAPGQRRGGARDAGRCARAAGRGAHRRRAPVDVRTRGFVGTGRGLTGMNELLAPVQNVLGPWWSPLWTLVKIVVIAVPLIIAVAYLTYAERKVIGWMQVRLGPNRVGPLGLLQPFADVLKMLFKEIIVPTGANRALFFIAPMLSLGPALAAWAVIPFTDTLVLSDINAGLLYILAMSSLGVYGVILAGWASNSKYAFLGCLRSAAQIVSYEIAMGFALVGVLMAANSLNLGDIVAGQEGGAAYWYVWPLLPLAVVYL